MAVTIKDVARESGVNISTVSRALNNEYGVNRETRDRVMAVAGRLNYRPNRVARGLVTGRSHSIGLVLNDIRNPFFAEVTRAAEDAAHAAGCELVLCNSDMDAAKQMRYVRSLLEKRVDAILMSSVSALSRAEQAQLASSGTPVVLLNRSAAQNAFSTVCSDDHAGGVLVARYLYGLGHRKIAHLTGPRQHGTFGERTRAFLQVLESAPSPVRPLVLRGNYTFRGAYSLAQQLWKEHPEITAIFTANDVMAFGVARAALDCGVRIPEDVSLIGFDNFELASVMHPPLTTIHQPKDEMGRAAVEVALRLASSKDHRLPEHRRFGVELIERQSCAPRKETP